jgi:hypothetical protein
MDGDNSRRGDFDAFVAVQMADIADRLSARFSGADKRFYAISRAQVLLDSQTGSLAKAYNTNGDFLWKNFPEAGQWKIVIADNLLCYTIKVSTNSSTKSRSNGLHS